MGTLRSTLQKATATGRRGGTRRLRAAAALLVAVTLAMQAIFAGTAAHAAAPMKTDSVEMVRDHLLTLDKGKLYLMKDKYTGRVLYCMTQYRPTPPEGHVMPRQKFPDASLEPIFDYLMYHGYSGDDTISIGNITGNADDLYFVTQCAIYEAVCPGYARKTFFQQDKPNDEHRLECLEVGKAFYQEAKAYADKGAGGPEVGAALSYHGVELTSEGHQPIPVQDMLTRKTGGPIRLRKASADPGITEGISGYSLSGAKFEVYKDASCSKSSLVAAIETDDKGEAVTPSLLRGTYWIKEVQAPAGYSVVESTVEAKVIAGSTTLSVAETPLYVPVGKVLAKVDAQTGTNKPSGAASLAGARFSVSYYDGEYDETSLPSSPTRSWTLTSDDEGLVRLDEAHLVGEGTFFTTHDGSAALPLGTVCIEEIDPSPGYAIPAVHRWVTKVRDLAGDHYAGRTFQFVPDGQVPEPVVRGDLKFEKCELGSQKAMPHVLFRMTSQTTGESHIIMTDDQGVFSSSSTPHSQDTNSLDAAVDEGGVVDPNAATKPFGTWFWGSKEADGAAAAVDDTRGALPYDTYTLQELPSEANEGHELVSLSVTITDDGSEQDLGKVEDALVTLSTSACEATTGTRYLSRKERSATIKDVVTYEGLTPETTYKLTCSLVDGATGTAIRDGSGTPYSSEAEFTTASSDGPCGGSQEMSLAVSPAGIASSKVVVFERLTSGGRVVATHEDLSDGEQSLYLPAIETTLADKGDGDKEVTSSSESQLTDTVSYQGLIPGETYHLEGTLVDGQSSSPVTPHSVTVDFVAERESGDVQVPFALDTTSLGGHTVVAFEKLSDDKGAVLCEHRDLTDADQSVLVIARELILPQTGQGSLMGMVVCSAVLLMAGLCGLEPWRHFPRH